MIYIFEKTNEFLVVDNVNKHAGGKPSVAPDGVACGRRVMSLFQRPTDSTNRI
jgi:hypothetical protein